MNSLWGSYWQRHIYLIFSDSSHREHSSTSFWCILLSNFLPRIQQQRLAVGHYSHCWYLLLDRTIYQENINITIASTEVTQQADIAILNLLIKSRKNRDGVLKWFLTIRKTYHLQICSTVISTWHFISKTSLPSSTSTSIDITSHLLKSYSHSCSNSFQISFVEKKWWTWL